MIPTDEQFEAVRRVRAAAEALTLAIAAKNGAATFIHAAFDPKVKTKPTRAQTALLRKIK